MAAALSERQALDKPAHMKIVMIVVRKAWNVYCPSVRNQGRLQKPVQTQKNLRTVKEIKALG